MNDLRVFTLEEANQLLPQLTDLLYTLQAKRDEVSEVEVKADAIELISDDDKHPQNAELDELMRTHKQLVSEFYSTVDEIHSHGCFLKDVGLGLIDFYGVVDQRAIYFCWHLGEEKIGFWHEIGKGYSFREPLAES